MLHLIKIQYIQLNGGFISKPVSQIQLWSTLLPFWFLAADNNSLRCYESDTTSSKMQTAIISPPTHTIICLLNLPACLFSCCVWNKSNLCSWTYTKLKCHPSELLLRTLETGVDRYDNLNSINKLSNVTGNLKLSNHTCQKKLLSS